MVNDYSIVLILINKSSAIEKIDNNEREINEIDIVDITN